MNDSYHKPNLAKKCYTVFSSEDDIEEQLALIFDPQLCSECGEDHSFKNKFEGVKTSIEDFPVYLRNKISGEAISVTGGK